jgi:hypothetical protein
MRIERKTEPPRPSGWWLCDDIGVMSHPISEALLVGWIRAGLVVKSSLVCQVGGHRWVELGDVTAFQDAWGDELRRFDPGHERCVVDLESLPPDPEVRDGFHTFDPDSEITAVEVPRPTPAPERSRGRGARAGVSSTE